MTDTTDTNYWKVHYGNKWSATQSFMTDFTLDTLFLLRAFYRLYCEYFDPLARVHVKSSNTRLISRALKETGRVFWLLWGPLKVLQRVYRRTKEFPVQRSRPSSSKYHPMGSLPETYLKQIQQICDKFPFGMSGYIIFIKKKNQKKNIRAWESLEFHLCHRLYTVKYFEYGSDFQGKVNY